MYTYQFQNYWFFKFKLSPLSPPAIFVYDCNVLNLVLIIINHNMCVSDVSIQFIYVIYCITLYLIQFIWNYILHIIGKIHVLREYRKIRREKRETDVRNAKIKFKKKNGEKRRHTRYRDRDRYISLAIAKL